MQKLLQYSDAAYPIGVSNGSKLFKIPSGRYSGRMVSVMMISPGEISDHDIQIAYADFPYNQWSELQRVVNTPENSSFDACMDDDGNLFIAYTESSTKNLIVIKLSFSNGSWLLEEPVIVYDGDENYFPVIVRQTDGRLWVFWSRYAGGSYYANVKYSDDGGGSWGSGSSDPGTSLTPGGASVYIKPVIMSGRLYAFYSFNGTKLAYRRTSLDVISWETEVEISTGSGFDPDFDAAVSSDGRIGIIYEDGILRYREFNGVSWGGIIPVENDGGCSSPQIKFINNDLYAIYLVTVGTNEQAVKYRHKSGETFANAEVLDPDRNNPEKLFLYNSISATFSDLTEEASNGLPGDVYHPDSSVLFEEAGDALYFGMNCKFHLISIALSVIGNGGIVQWEYYSGESWVSFIPDGGAFSFDAAEKKLYLWPDYLSVPSDWQKTNINGSNLFWIRISVSASYSTGPVGSRLTTYSNIQQLSLMR